MKIRSLVKITCVSISLITVISCSDGNGGKLNEELWYQQPAKFWNSQALHIGNGYMGASIMGGVEKEVITLSEKSMWTGGPFTGDWSEVGVNPDCKEKLPEIRKLILQGDHKKADIMARKYYIGENNNFGYFTSIGDLEIDFMLDSGKYTDYNRFLDLSQAVSGVSFKSNGIKYTREYFCSYPDRIIGVKLTAGRKALNFNLGAKIMQDVYKEIAKKNVYEIHGNINGNNRPFHVLVQVDTDGDIEISDNQKLSVRNAEFATLYIAISTNYAMKQPGYTGEEPWITNTETLQSIAGKSYNQLRSEHIRDYTSLYAGVELHLTGNEGIAKLPTDKRWKLFVNGGKDPGLKEMAFNLGRYLIISSSRPNTLPANLQGVWNKFVCAPWAGNYQSNINLQEIYWSCGPTALLECQEAYIEWIKDLSVWGKEIAARCYGSEGWTSHATGNIWGHATPTGALSWGVYPAAAAWHCQHIWEQFAFGLDTGYLQSTAYPLMKAAALFYLNNLSYYKDKLILIPAVSAEHGAYDNPSGLVAASESGDTTHIFNIPGTAQDVEMIWDLFSNTVSASVILKADVAFRHMLEGKMKELLPLKIGKYGQLQEWDYDIDNPNGHHRHIAHLYAVAPGHQIHPLIDQKFSDAAKKSLEMRGEGRFMADDPASGGNWSMAHRMWCWARLLEGDRANELFDRLLSEQGFENLLTFQHSDYHWERKDFYNEGEGLYCHFQLDASASIPGFMAELLLQSHLDGIDLLPALPEEWSEGYVRGLRARGGYTVDLEWKHHKLVKAVITSLTGKIPKVMVESKIVDLKHDNRIRLN